MPEQNRYQMMTDHERKKHLAYAKVYRKEATASRNLVKILINFFIEIEEIIPQENIDMVTGRMNERELRLFQKWALLAKASIND